MAVPIALGLPVELVYLAFSTWCSFASLGLLFVVLRRGFRLAYRVSVLVVLLCASHLLFLRAFARPVTDALGQVLTIGSLALLVWRAREPSALQRGGLALLNVLHPLARPQGIAFVPFVTLAALVIDRRRRTSAVRTVIELLVVPAAILATLVLLFGWWHNAAALVEERALFADWFTPRDFGWSLLVTVQVLPLLWVAGWRHGVDRASIALLVWIIYYLGVLVAARAPFWARHFLPLLPALLVLTALAIDRTRGHLRTVGLVAVVLLAAANVGVVAHFIFDRSNLSLRLLPSFSLG